MEKCHGDAWKASRQCNKRFHIWNSVCYASHTNFTPCLLICFLVNSRPNSQAKQQGVPYMNNFAPPSFQETNPSYPSGQPQMLQGQPEQFADVEGLLSGMPRGLGTGAGGFSDWSKEFTDLWSFPGGEFGFDDMAFTQ